MPYKDSEVKKQYHKEYYAAHKGIPKKFRDNYDENKVVVKKTRWESGLLYQYNITASDYYKILDSQGGCCAICGSDGWDYPPCIDHDHSCCPGPRSCGDCVRGLICKSCNTGLGYFKDDRISLISAVNYLDRWRIIRKNL